MKTRSIAAFVRSMSVSQNTFYMIKEFNRCLERTDLSPCIIYQENAVPPIAPMCACKMATPAISFPDTIITTTINEADALLKISNKSKRFLYLWNLNWLETPVHFDYAMKVLRDPRLSIIARSESHASCIENFCNKKTVGVLDNWNLENLLKITK